MPDTDESRAPPRAELCALPAVRRVAAMLDLDPDRFRDGDPLPRGWHFTLLAADTRRSQLRNDGFPGFGAAVPDLGFGRLMLGRRHVAFHRDIPIGTALQRLSSIKSVARKETASGPMAFVTVSHALQAGPLAVPDLIEEATYVLLGDAGAAGRAPTVAEPRVTVERERMVTPDETLLFHYSALGFNSHKIHLDRGYACNVEGYPDLVVNGGLTTLLLTEFLRTDLCLSPTTIDVRHTAPLFCSRPIRLAAGRDGDRWRLMAFDDGGRLAVDMEVQVR